MNQDVFERLRDQLDQYSVGFPAAPSGVELDILKNLFTAEEAKLFLLMSLRLETAQGLAERIGWPSDQAAELLTGMSKKGLVFHRRKGDLDLYAAVPFVLGIYEFQSHRIDKDAAELYARYFDEAFGSRVVEGQTLLRPVPVNRSVEPNFQVAPYEDARAIIRNQESIAVAKCLCRIQYGLLEEGCDKPLEVCLAFGRGAQHFIDQGLGRPVSVDEALEILNQAEKAGLVPQPTNSQVPEGMCNCCGDCCAQLRALNRLERPADVIKPNYFAVVDADNCTGCETCMDRCQMAAIRVSDDGLAEVLLERCIGCGLCVTTCPTEAIRLEPKSDEERHLPHNTAVELLMDIANQRGTSLIPLSMQDKKADA